MFDSQGTAAAVVGEDADACYERHAALAELPTEEELTAAGVEVAPPWGAEADFDGWLTALVAADPDRPRDPRQLIDRAEHDPVSVQTVIDLHAVDPAGLDDGGLVGLVVGWQRVANHALARRAEAVAGFTATLTGMRAVGVGVPAQAAAEIGAALALGRGGADLLIDTVLLLTDRLPDTLAAVRAGDVSWDKAVTLAQRTACLSVDQARDVEARVLPHAAGRTPARHGDAVRRAVDRIDPDGAADRRRQAKRDIALIRTHHGDGMGELFTRLPCEQADTIWTAADAHARRAKAAGDLRTLDELRVAALVRWAESFLTHGDPTHCDTTCLPVPTHTDTDSGSGGEPEDDGPNDAGPGPDDDGPSEGGPTNGPDDAGPDGPDDAGPDDAGPDDTGGPDDAGPDDTGGPDNDDAGPDPDAGPDDAGPVDSSGIRTETAAAAAPVGRAGPPTRHGRPVRVGAIWDLTSLLGLTRHVGELTDSGATLPPDAMVDLVARGLRLRRMLIDPDTGELVDLTPRSWTLPAADGATGHPPPVMLGVTLTTDVHTALTTGDLTGLPEDAVTLVQAISAALDQAHPVLRALVEFPVTADRLDDHPDAQTPSPALAEFVAVRDRHPTNPTAGPTAASAADLDHTTSRAAGGPTIRENLTSVGRRWHLLKTHGHWTVQKIGRQWHWTSPTGRTHTTQPYDYRLGP